MAILSASSMGRSLAICPFTRRSFGRFRLPAPKYRELMRVRRRVLPSTRHSALATRSRRHTSGEIAVSDRTTLRGLTQFVFDDLAGVPLTDWHHARCRIEYA